MLPALEKLVAHMSGRECAFGTVATLCRSTIARDATSLTFACESMLVRPQRKYIRLNVCDVVSHQMLAFLVVCIRAGAPRKVRKRQEINEMDEGL